jgi:Mrp family chromosome partitioning ATPase
MTTAPPADLGVEFVDPADVAVLTTTSADRRAAPNNDVMAAVRYLLYRHELTVGAGVIPQMIAVIAANHGDGVTTVSRSLAEVLAAERNSRVCWVDFGSDRLSTSSPLGPPEIAALDDTPVVMIAPDRQPNVPVRSASFGDEFVARRGPLARPELDELVDNLARGYRHVVFDTPPLLSRPDSIGLLRRADAYILVARHGRTSLTDIRRVSDELRSIPSLGAVLNAQRIRTPRFMRRLVTG